MPVNQSKAWVSQRKVSVALVVPACTGIFVASKHFLYNPGADYGINQPQTGIGGPFITWFQGTQVANGQSLVAHGSMVQKVLYVEQACSHHHQV